MATPDITKLPGFRTDMTVDERVELARNAIEVQRQQRFEEIWDAELAVRSESASQAFGANLTVRERARQNGKAAKARLYAMIQGLTPAETAEYGKFRCAMLAEEQRG